MAGQLTPSNDGSSAGAARPTGSIHGLLLVCPRFPQTFWSFDRAVDLMGHRVLLPPLGLITVAALLPQSWEFQLVDCNTEPADGGDRRRVPRRLRPAV